MLKDLIKLANDLDKRGLRKEADYLDALMKRAELPSLASQDSINEFRAWMHSAHPEEAKSFGVEMFGQDDKLVARAFEEFGSEYAKYTEAFKDK